MLFPPHKSDVEAQGEYKERGLGSQGNQSQVEMHWKEKDPEHWLNMLNTHISTLWTVFKTYNHGKFPSDFYNKAKSLF